MSTHYDVIIIGSGAGGGTLFHALAPTGKRILLLERGGYVPREKDNWSTKAVNLEGKYNTKDVWHDGAGNALHPHTNYYLGGNTKFYGAASGAVNLALTVMANALRVPDHLKARLR